MRITQRTPRPTAPPTSSLPARAGRWVCGRDTKPRRGPPGGGSTRMLPSGASPPHWRDTRSSALESPRSRSPAVSARPSAAVAVGSVPCRTRASSTSSVVTAARPRTVPSALRVRARRSATARLLHGAQHLRGAHQASEAAALAAVRTEKDERRHAGHAEPARERARALVLGGHVHFDHHEVGRRAYDRGVPERGALHLAARQAPRGLEVEEDGPARGGGARKRLVGEREPRDRALGLDTQDPDQPERDQRDSPGTPRPSTKKSAKPSATDCRAPTKRRSASTAGPMQGAATTPMVRPMKKAPRSPSPTWPKRCTSGDGTRS